MVKINLSFAQKLRKLKKAGIQQTLSSQTVHINELTPLDERIKQILGLAATNNKKANEMIYFVMYDIEDNKVRTHIAKYLIRKGCTRVQKSIFLANTQRNVYNEIYTNIKEVQDLYQNTDSIFFVPVSTDEIRSMKVVGNNLDFDLILKNKNTLFF